MLFPSHDQQGDEVWLQSDMKSRGLSGLTVKEEVYVSKVTNEPVRNICLSINKDAKINPYMKGRGNQATQQDALISNAKAPVSCPELKPVMIHDKPVQPVKNDISLNDRLDQYVKLWELCRSKIDLSNSEAGLKLSGLMFEQAIREGALDRLPQNDLSAVDEAFK